MRLRSCRSRLGFVLVLALFVLALHDNAGRQVRDADRAFRLVDLLAARAARAHRVDLQVFDRGCRLRPRSLRAGRRRWPCSCECGPEPRSRERAGRDGPPLSNCSCWKAPSPVTEKTTSFRPPSSVGLRSRTSYFQPRLSANRLYMSNSSAANRAASSPPVPARISMIRLPRVAESPAVARSSSSASSAFCSPRSCSSSALAYSRAWWSFSSSSSMRAVATSSLKRVIAAHGPGDLDQPPLLALQRQELGRVGRDSPGSWSIRSSSS